MNLESASEAAAPAASFLPLDLPELFVGGYSTRFGGVSPPPYDTLNLSFRVGDYPKNVRENRLRLASALSLDLDCFVFPQLAHSGGIAVVSDADRGRGAYDYESAFPQTDALITSTAGVVLAVNVADCVPIILIDEDTPAVAVVHAGWRGTVARIAEGTVRAMQDAFGSRPKSLKAFIGPSIGPTSYLVSAEVGHQAIAACRASEVVARSSDGSFRLDLWAANAHILKAAGIPPENIECSETDTMLSQAFFSARRQSMTGRFAGLVAIRRG